MAGIEDLMNIRTQGGTANAPPMPPRGGPPPGMAGPPPGMGEMAAAGAPPMGEDPGMDIEQDSAMLAEAVVGRAQGDVGAAIAVLDTAKAMLISSVEQPPMDGPPMGEPPMQAAYGKPLMRRGGGPLYRDMGGTIDMTNDILSRLEGADSDILRQMIMDNLQKGREMSDRDVTQGQTGRAMSDRDRALSRMMRHRRS